MGLLDKRLRLKIHGNTYDVTEYVSQHPGGRKILEAVCFQEKDKDVTEEFERFGHSVHARTLLEELSLHPVMPESTSVTSVPWRTWIQRKLFTSEDYRQLHKTLGLMSCLHLLPRIGLACFYGFDVVGVEVCPIVRSLLVLVQLSLSLSSLQFHVPVTSNVHKPMIHALFRAHSIVFTSRAVVCTLCIIWLGSTSTISIMLRAMTIILAMTAADKASYHLTDPSDNFLTIRSLMYWPEISRVRMSIHRFLYAFTQFGATYVCLGLDSEIMVLSTLLGIQGVAFLMTLVRKSIIQPYTFHMVYTAQLLTSVVLHICTRSVASSVWGTIVVFTLYMVRVRLYMDKYLLWGLFVCGMNFVDGICHLPTLCIVALLCTAGWWSHQKDLVVVQDPTSRIVATVQTGETHCRLQIRTRNRLVDFRPGQFVTVSNGTVTRKYTPVSVSHTDKQSVVDLVIRRYPSPTFSDYLYHRVVGDVVVVAGPFGDHYYDAPTTTLHFGTTSIPLVPGTDVPAVVLVAGGSGIAPMYNLATTMLASGLCVVLVTADTSIETALLYQECTDLYASYPETFIWYAHMSSQGTRMQSVDLVTYTASGLVCACGPPGMLAFIRNSLPETQELCIW